MNGGDPIMLPSAPRGVLLISGWRRAGKTTLLLRLREAALGAGLTVGGFLSPERSHNGEKVGIDLLDVATGERVSLATVGGEGAVRTGHYTFDPAALDAGLRFARAGQDADVYFVDELGPLELVRGEGWASVIPLIGARRSADRGLSLVVVRPELIDAARQRLDLPAGSPVVEINEATRQALSAALEAWISG
ncbi:MAG TPA: nucleoside-triphosphatase [Aggregatilinea sp.]|jgi:nucleoside-triphosphatase|uniref:nucleoside-triphosphatase n=1 Tax=Aggregatilinea sp. TaxID=2806333 RepID=UPI002CF60FF6|nr:nucleoside-triphosphatase [Aggregatilinea sp.]HML22781.1 nucleoside-triphosphatase [Aggregatilinea sp.]